MKKCMIGFSLFVIASFCVSARSANSEFNVRSLLDRIVALEERVAALERRLAMDSQEEVSPGIITYRGDLVPWYLQPDNSSYKAVDPKKLEEARRNLLKKRIEEAGGMFPYIIPRNPSTGELRRSAERNARNYQKTERDARN